MFTYGGNDAGPDFVIIVDTAAFHLNNSYTRKRKLKN